jgi:hypothetical protein
MHTQTLRAGCVCRTNMCFSVQCNTLNPSRLCRAYDGGTSAKVHSIYFMEAEVFWTYELATSRVQV